MRSALLDSLLDPRRLSASRCGDDVVGYGKFDIKI